MLKLLLIKIDADSGIISITFFKVCRSSLKNISMDHWGGLYTSMINK